MACVEAKGRASGAPLPPLDSPSLLLPTASTRGAAAGSSLAYSVLAWHVSASSSISP
jgi:hypothetical protein